MKVRLNIAFNNDWKIVQALVHKEAHPMVLLTVRRPKLPDIKARWDGGRRNFIDPIGLDAEKFFQDREQRLTISDELWNRVKQHSTRR